jgi:ribonuclease HII
MRTEDEIKIKINETLYTAMVDECGAGPLCGDLVVAAVILDPNNPIVGLNDSKKLTEKKRELLYPQIIEKALDYCIIHISPKEIDKINIFQARMLGMKMAIEGLKRVDYAVIDGNKIPQGLVVEADYVIKGDAKIEGIGAASILAKVTRDRQMEEQSKIYPGYGFEKHKGYGTKVHMDALKELGPCEIHRFSYAPVKEAVR